MTISSDAMTLIGLIITAAVILATCMIVMGKYQQKVDQNEKDIEEEAEQRRASDLDLDRKLSDERSSRYKRDSDFGRDMRRYEERLASMERERGRPPLEPDDQIISINDNKRKDA